MALFDRHLSVNRPSFQSKNIVKVKVNGKFTKVTAVVINSADQFGSMMNLEKLDIWSVLLFVVTIFTLTSDCVGINPQTTLECHQREYRYRADKNFVTKTGQVLKCWDYVKVYSCWGRCDSFEYGDYKIPYKVSYHPVCTYEHKRPRTVRLRHCHPDHPDPTYEVFDAVACRCKLCNPEYTSCENLNG